MLECIKIKRNSNALRELSTNSGLSGSGCINNLKGKLVK